MDFQISAKEKYPQVDIISIQHWKAGGKSMDVSSASAATTTLAASAQQMQQMVRVQVEMMKEIAQLQEQTAQMLAEAGIGMTIDVSA